MEIEEKDFYALLGVSPRASAEEIKSAYRTLARKYHPDHDVNNEHEELFKQITDAYKCLSNSEKRYEYNKTHGYEHVQFLDDMVDSEPQDGMADTQIDLSPHLDITEPAWKKLRRAQAEDLKISHRVALTPEEEPVMDEDEVAPWGEDELPRGGAFGLLSFLKRKEKAAKKKAPSKAELKRMLQEASQPVRPVERQSAKIKVNRAEAAAFARGPEAMRDERVFQFQISEIEQRLGAMREIVFPGRAGEEPRRVRVKIPAGIKSNTILQVTKGWERAKVRIIVQAEDYLTVDDIDLHLTVPVTVSEAIRGATIEIPGLHKPLRLTIPPGTQLSGELLRQGEGLTDEKQEKGDLFVRLFVVPPRAANEAAQAACAVIEKKYRVDVRKDIKRNELFSRSAAGTFLLLPVTLGEAMRGATVSFPSPDGGEQLSITLPRRWQMSEQELPDAGSDGTPLIVRPFIVLPESTDSDFAEAVEALERAYNDPIRAALPRQLLPE